MTPKPVGARPFEVETPEVVASVKGTRFYISLDSGPGTSISVFDGAVELRERADDEAFPVLVRAGFTARGGGGLAMKMWVNELDDPWESWEATELSAPALLPSANLLDTRTLRETVSELESDDSGIVGLEADEAFFENETPASNTDTGGWGTGTLDGDDDASVRGGSSNSGSSGSGNKVIGIVKGAVPALDND